MGDEYFVAKWFVWGRFWIGILDLEGKFTFLRGLEHERGHGKRENVVDVGELRNWERWAGKVGLYMSQRS
jgi:hypothetical protein